MTVNVNTIVGALVAALLNFLTAVVALFANDAELTLSMITQAAWISMIGGAVIQFLKDYQAISARRLINKITKTGDGGGTVG